MASVTFTLKRVFQKGLLCFELPKGKDAQEALKNVLVACRDKSSDFVKITLSRPYKARSTGKSSQNHHLNGHIMQICSETGNDYETIKYCIKMIAVEEMGYPYSEICGHILPKRESESDSSECALLIEASHILAARLSIILREQNDD